MMMLEFTESIRQNRSNTTTVSQKHPFQFKQKLPTWSGQSETFDIWALEMASAMRAIGTRYHFAVIKGHINHYADMGRGFGGD